MQILGKGLRQAIGDGFNHDLVIVIMLRFIGVRQRVLFQAAGHGEGADVVRLAAQLRRDKIGEAVVGEANLLRLLAQMMAHRQHVGAGFIAIDFNIVAHAVGREQTHHAARVQGFLCAQLIQQLVSIFEQALRLFPYHFIFQNARIFTRQRPGHEERRPVDVVAQGLDTGFHRLYPQTMSHRRCVALPVKGQIVFPCGGQGHRRRARFFTSMLDTHGLILFARAGDKLIALRIREQRSHHPDGARGVLYVNGRAAVVLLDFHRRMRFRGSRAAYQQRDGKALALHLFRHVNHLVQ